MLDSHFTPGPWKCGIERMGDPDVRKIWAVSLQVASAECFWISLETQEANARLIAAAPDLYNVAVYVRDNCDTDSVLQALLDKVFEAVQP